MANQTNISWCDSTFNPWMGCTKVSPACDHCYAERDTARFGRVEWGAGKPRVRTSAANWRKPLQWNKQPFYECKQCGWRGATKYGNPVCCDERAQPARRRVFCASLADVFDNEVDPQWRDGLFGLIAATQNLDWLLLTKRIGNARGMLPALSIDAAQPWPNVWIGATICNQAEADRDIPKLLRVPAAARFLSIEPMLSRINLRAVGGVICDYETGTSAIDALTGDCVMLRNGIRGVCTTDGDEIARRPFGRGVDWVIAGGESGPNARPIHPDWVRSLRDQCAAAGVPFHFKQWGQWAPLTFEDGPLGAHIMKTAITMAEPGFPQADMMRIGKKAADRELDGVTHDAFPTRRHTHA